MFTSNREIKNHDSIQAFGDGFSQYYLSCIQEKISVDIEKIKIDLLNHGRTKKDFKSYAKVRYHITDHLHEKMLKTLFIEKFGCKGLAELAVMYFSVEGMRFYDLISVINSIKLELYLFTIYPILFQNRCRDYYKIQDEQIISEMYHCIIKEYDFLISEQMKINTKLDITDLQVEEKEMSESKDELIKKMPTLIPTASDFQEEDEFKVTGSILRQRRKLR